VATDWLLLDGSSLIFRAFFGIPKTIRAPGGMPVNAIRGFLDNVARLLVERRPGHFAVATDEDWRPAFRVDLLPSYKAHRTAEPIPPELDPQVPIAWDVMEAIGLAVARADGYEAEDVIASLAAGARGRIEIVSGDRDLFALVRDPDVVVLYPEKTGLSIVDEAAITARYGIPGRSYTDFAILRGDPSDGLPGLRGVGPQKAADLLRRFGHLDGIIAGARLSVADIDYLRRARQVVEQVDNLDLPGEYAVPAAPRDPARLDALSKEYGLGSSVERVLRALPAAGVSGA
jgi:5'-3' exonuclease